MANLPARRDTYGLAPAVHSDAVQRQMTGKPVRGILREAGKQALEQQLQAEQTAAALYYKAAARASACAARGAPTAAPPPAWPPASARR